MVVLEDVDLIAEERGFHHSGPLLFELLNALDGLGDDHDVIFVLTTNRPDVLEPALAARPGRVDLAVELGLPDAEGRHRLIERHARGLQLTDVDLDGIVARTAGASPAYLKELLRLAATLAAIEAGEPSESSDALTVRGSHLVEAISELGGGSLAGACWDSAGRTGAAGGSRGPDSRADRGRREVRDCTRRRPQLRSAVQGIPAPDVRGPSVRRPGFVRG